MRYDFLTRAGERIGVLWHRGGRRELLLYALSDPDACREALALTAEESATLAQLLWGVQVTRHPGSRRHPFDGLALDWVEVPADSPFAGATIAAAGVRSVTGVSIVAVLRQGVAFPSPRPDFTLRAGDTTVVVGTPEGIDALVELLET